jgi:flagellar protein FlaJ
MSLTNYVPLAFALALFSTPFVATASRRIDRFLTRIALFAFGPYVSEHGRKPTVKRARLRAGHYPTTLRQYAAKTYLYAAFMALFAGITGMYLIWGTLLLLAIDADTIRSAMPSRLDFLANYVGVPSLTIDQLFVLVTVTSLTLGAVAAVVTYWFRWWYPETVANDRSRRIEATLPQSVAFVYALSRSGMAFPEVLRALARNRRIYGDTSEEAAVAVRHMDLFGTDVITAIQMMGRRSPSPQFKEFSENLASVLRSGRSLSEFLRRQYEEFQEEAEAQQEQLIDLLGTLAEAYVTAFVAGPLFLITILVVIGISSVGNTLQPLRVLVYAIIPIANAVFVLYLSQSMGALNPRPRFEHRLDEGRELVGLPSRSETTAPAETDGGPVSGVANVERLRAYRRFRALHRRLGRPVRSIVDRPERVLYLTVPVALLLTGVRLLNSESPLAVTAIDDLLIQATLFLVGTFAIAYEVHKRRIEDIESAVPDFLDRLASVNEAGMTIVESLNRVRGSELGALDEELDRVWYDVQWGSNVEMALRRFERRVRTRTVSRIVTLITNAMNASGDLARVLRIAANQAKADRRLKRDRRQEMVSYMIVVYVSFFVFLFIIAILNVVLIPNLPDQTIVGNATAGGATNVPAVAGAGQVGSIDQGAYKLIFFHTGVIQGMVSGFVAGQLSTGDVRDGAKHAAIMTAIAYVVFLVFLG